jgi:hypothetical protein
MDAPLPSSVGEPSEGGDKEINMDELDRLKEKIITLEGYLREAHKENNALLESRVISATYTITKQFAEAARIVRMDGGIIPANQITASVEMRMNYAGIIPMQTIGEIVEFDGSTMQNVSINGKDGELVKIVDPGYKIVINNNDYILTFAWVKNIGEK